MPPRKTRSSTRNAMKANAPHVPDTPLAMPKPIVPNALEEAIDTMPERWLRDRMKHFCEKLPRLRSEMQAAFVIRVEDVVPYQYTDDLEDASTSHKRKRGGRLTEPAKKRKLKLAIDALQEVPRWVTCENCKAIFDLADNEKGDCVWHKGGSKRVNREATVWNNSDSDDEDEKTPIDYKAYEDDDEYQGGFQWTCCGKDGYSDGCKMTKHKNSVNYMTAKSGETPPQEVKLSKAQSDITDCRRCYSMFDIHQNKPNICSWHPGDRIVTHENDFWDDHDERIGGAYETLAYDSDYEEGFVYSCCGEPISEEGCKKGKHVSRNPH